MQKKKVNHWLDAQVIITFLAMSASLVMWGLFAKITQNDAVAGQTTTSVVSSASSSDTVPQTRIFLGGSAPQIRNAPASQSWPSPFTTTGSSKP